MEESGYCFLAVNLPNEELSFPIPRQPKVIGRGEGADIRIQHRNFGVSRQHARVWMDEQVMIEDLGSSVGTWVHLVKLDPHVPVPLHEGDRLRLGMLELALVSEEEFSAMNRWASWTLRDDEDSLPIPPDDKHAAILARNALPEENLMSCLTPREREVVIWLMRGVHSEAEIGKRIGRSHNTIRTHLNNIFRKLNVHSRHELMGRLLRAGSDLPDAPV